MTGLRWVADECIPRSLVEQMRAEGHDVLFVAEGHRGSDDEFALQLAISDRRLLLTQDADFGELLFRRRTAELSGLVLLRISPERAAMRWSRLKSMIATLGNEIFGRLVVIEEGRTRSRLMRPPL